MRLLLTAIAFLAVAAPAQADITSSVITTPADPHFLLSRGPGRTIHVAGRAVGDGNVQIVCDGLNRITLAADVPVATDGTFEVDSVSVDPLVDHTDARSPGQTCRLRAIGTGDTASFRGPLLGVSKFHAIRGNDGAFLSFYLYAAGASGGTAVDGAFGGCGLWTADSYGLTCAGSPTYEPPATGLKIDGEPVQSAAQLARAGLADLPGFPSLSLPFVDFDAATGAVSVTERNTFRKCGELGEPGAFPPTPAACATFWGAGVQLERTTTVLPGDQVVRIVDRWTSTDGLPHRLDYAVENEFGSSPDIAFRFPGESGFADHEAGDVITGLTARGPVLARDADPALPGAVVLPMQAPDAATFYGGEAYDLAYRARTIPATGELTFTHYYVTTRRSDEVEAAAAKLLASLPQPPAPVPPHGGGAHPATPPALPRFSRGGRVRVRRSGRTFRVVTRDRVTCPAACTVHVSGRRVVATDLHVAAGATAAVRFRLTRAGARTLRRAGRLRLRVALTAPGVHARRTVRLRLG